MLMLIKTSVSTVVEVIEQISKVKEVKSAILVNKVKQVRDPQLIKNKELPICIKIYNQKKFYFRKMKT